MDLNTQTSEILKLISDTSDSICSNKVLFPKEIGEKDKADRLLIGLMTCLVAAMGDNSKLAYNILPEYLNSLANSVTNDEYKKCSNDTMYYYEKFRDIGAKVQFASADWEDVMTGKFSEYIISTLNAHTDETSISQLNSIVKNLVDISKTYTESEVTIVNMVSHKKTIIALAVCAVLFLVSLGLSFVYALNLRSKYNKINENVQLLQNQNSELTSTVASQEEVIASLNGQIDDLISQNSELGDEITEFSAYIEEHESDIQVAEHIGSYDADGEEGTGRFYADNYVVTTSGEEVSINVTMDFYGTCDLQGDNKRITAAWGDHFTDNGTIKVTFTPVKKGATTFHFFNDQNDDTFDVLVIYI